MKLTHPSVILGFITVLCWGSLAALGKLLEHLPPFYLLGASFLVGALPGVFKFKKMFVHPKIMIWGIAGYFFYHFFLFYSFRFAPALEADLINYLWPVLLVLFTPLFFPQERLKPHHFVGGALAIIGCCILLVNEAMELRLGYFKGYFLAFGAALTWPIYSLGKKKLPEVSVWAISGFCLGTSLLSFFTHALIEPSVTLQPNDALLIALLGLGPFGLAFYTWDLALLKGDAQVIGALSYLTPLFSVLGLIFFTDEVLTQRALVAMLLIIGGASTGLLDLKKRP